MMQSQQNKAQQTIHFIGYTGQFSIIAIPEIACTVWQIFLSVNITWVCGKMGTTAWFTLEEAILFVYMEALCIENCPRKIGNFVTALLYS